MAPDQLITLGQIAPYLSGFIAALISVVIYFMKREMDRHEEKQHEHKERADRQDARIERLEAGQQTAEKAQAAIVVAAKAELLAAIEAVERDLTDAQRGSHSGLETSEDRLRKEFLDHVKELQVELKERAMSHQSLREIVLQHQATNAEKFLPRQEFIRDNTILDSKIAATSRSIRLVQESMDNVLRTYLKED